MKIVRMAIGIFPTYTDAFRVCLKCNTSIQKTLISTYYAIAKVDRFIMNNLHY